MDTADSKERTKELLPEVQMVRMTPFPLFRRNRPRPLVKALRDVRTQSTG